MKHARDDYDRIQDPAGIIPDDEPVFLLRGQDKIAAETVRFYAQRTIDHGGDPVIARAAFDQAKRMEKWPKKKLADLPEFATTEAAPEEPTKPKSRKRKATQ